MRNKIEFYILDLQALGYSEDKSKDIVCDIEKTCKLSNTDFDVIFNNLIQFLRTESISKISNEELKQLSELKYREPEIIKPKFNGYHNSKRKQLRNGNSRF